MFALCRVYNVQQEYAELTRGIMRAMYLRPPDENLDAFSKSLALYYGDIIGMEPALVGMYDDVVPRLNEALGESASGQK
jgi:hypothetical protein